MDDYFLMKSYSTPAIIVACYFVALKFGPVLMKNRQPYDLKSVLVLYNLLQIYFNFYLFTKSISMMRTTGILCSAKYESTPELVDTLMDTHYKYILLKLYDLFDTMLFVLRKKDNQITFLHVHHHVSMFIYVWSSGKLVPATSQMPVGPGVFLGFWNTMVHIIMYTYYLLSAITDSVKHSWWKKYITLIQLVQHASLFTIGLISLAQEDCPYPKIWLAIAVSLIGSVMYLFAIFYYQTYVKGKKSNNEKVKLKN